MSLIFSTIAITTGYTTIVRILLTASPVRVCEVDFYNYGVALEPLSTIVKILLIASPVRVCEVDFYNYGGTYGAVIHSYKNPRHSISRPGL